MRARPELSKPALAARQHEFALSLREREEIVPPGLTSPAAVAVRRFNVHRNSMYSGLVGCIEATFPVVRRLVGNEFFVATASVFVANHPPRSPVLIEYGAEFASFLDHFAPVRSLPYLADVARLEWLLAQSRHAADAVPISGEALGRMSADEAWHAGIVLHPALRLLRSSFSVVSIWQTNTFDAVVRPIDACGDGECALIVRPEFAPRVVPIDFGEFTFLAELANDEPLGIAAATAAERAPGFDLTRSLLRIFAIGAVAGVGAVAYGEVQAATRFN